MYVAVRRIVFQDGAQTFGRAQNWPRNSKHKNQNLDCMENVLGCGVPHWFGPIDLPKECDGSRVGQTGVFGGATDNLLNKPLPRKTLQ